MTDFGPAFSLNIGGIAVFGRNGDPNQSIIFAATGEGDTRGFQGTHPSAGVGILRSMDGGASWTLLDSTTNADANGNILPITSPLRDHVFLDTTAYKIVVDPKPTPSGQVIIYAAMGGVRPGIYRSVDSGKHWQNTTANIPELQNAEATDVVLDPNSGRFNVDENPTGNLQIVYSAFRGSGVWVSPQSEGTTWNKLLGLDGGLTLAEPLNPLIPIPVNPATTTPTGKGRIVLAKPALTGHPLQDQLYEGWLYAVAIDDAGTPPSGGIYMTKDYGHNWTRIPIPGYFLLTPAPFPSYIPTNDTTKSDYPLFGAPPTFQGDYDVDAAIDPPTSFMWVGWEEPASSGSTPPASPIRTRCT